MSKISQIREQYPDVLIMDGFDDCILGVCSRMGQETIVAYDFVKVVQKLIKQGMNEEEALEWFEYNQLGAWMGKMTPCFVERIEDDNNKRRSANRSKNKRTQRKGRSGRN